MARKTAKSIGKYIYAVIPGDDERVYGRFGIDGGAVYGLSDGAVQAVVSDVPNRKIRPERRSLAAHQEVIDKLMQVTTPLPMRYGVIADGPGSVLKILSLNRKTFLDQLKRVAGKFEMGLRVNWDVPNVIEYFVFTHPELQAARDRFLGRRKPSRDERIEMGRTFNRILTQDREDCAEKVEEVLSGCCVEIRRNRPGSEREVLNLACLVERVGTVEFESAVFKAAKLFDNSFAFNYSGPWAPHNFVQMDLQF